MFTLSSFLVFVVLLSAAYWYIMRLYKLKNKEVEEKIEEQQEYTELDKKAKKVNVEKLQEKKEHVNEVRKA